MMTDNELKKLAQYIVEEQATNAEWMLQFAKAQEKVRKGKSKPQWVNSEKAAEILGIKPRAIREIKVYFTHIKSGSEKQGNIYFDANKLREEYDCYIASKNRVVRLKPEKVAVGK